MDKSKSIRVLVTESLLTPQCTNSRNECFSIECQDESEAKFWRQCWFGLSVIARHLFRLADAIVFDALVNWSSQLT